VLHDMCAISFEEIAAVLDRSPAAARQLASRARRRVHGEAKIPDAALSVQQEVVEAFFAAAREGEMDRLLALLHPDVVLHADAGPGESSVLRGPAAVARASLSGARSGRTLRSTLVNGSPGAVVFEHGQPVAIIGYTVVQGSIVEIDVLRDPDRLRRLDPASAIR
jgi:hypothetical protein